MRKRKIISSIRGTLSYGYGELKGSLAVPVKKRTKKKVIKTKLTPEQIKRIKLKRFERKRVEALKNYKKKTKKMYKKVSHKQIRKSLGYENKLNLEGLY